MIGATRGCCRWWLFLAVAAQLAQLSCAHPAPPAAPVVAAPASVGEAAAGEAALPPLPKLPPPPPTVEHPELRPITVVARDVSDGIETLIAATNDGLGCNGRGTKGAAVRIEGASDPRRPWSGWFNHVDGADGRPALEGGHLIIRRPVPGPDEHQIAHVYQAGGAPWCPGAPQHFRFALPGPGGPAREPAVLAYWAEAFADHVGDDTAWAGFARQRARARFPEPLAGRPVATAPAKLPRGKGKPSKAQATGTPPTTTARPRVTPARRDPSELARLMDTTSGMTSLQETLQTDRWLVATDAGAATVPLAAVKGPPLPQHPWPAMLTALAAQKKKVSPPDEPLAAAAPAGFYFVRFRSIGDLIRLRAEMDKGLSASLVALEDRLADYDLAERYEAELGIKQGPMTRLLGPAVIDDLAVVGSDPYLREGSDLTLVFRVKAKPAFEAGLATTLTVQGAAHGGVSVSSVERGGVTIQIATSPDGAIRRHRATVGGFELVSNSLGGLERVIAAIQKRAPCLADELDFRYMMARDAAVTADVLAFMSDRFVAEVVGPRQKILEARRQLALAELSRPGFAALLYGWLFGRAPASAAELLASGLLTRGDLAHADGETIAWTPEAGARSSWGQVGGLLPLIDRPVPAKVTAAESEAYKLFVAGYQNYWRTYIDPVAVRIALPADGKGPLAMELRVLPIIDGTDYAELSRTVGRARVVVGEGRQGARAVLGIGADASIRQLLSRSLREMPLVGALKIDWLGDWATFGIDDAARPDGEAVPVGDGTSQLDLALSQLSELPVFAGVEVRSPAAAVAFLAGARQVVESAAPGMIDWREAGKHRDVPFVAVRAARDKSDLGAFKDISLYYTFCKGSLFLSLAEAALRRRIDDCVDGRRPQAPAAGSEPDPQSAQLVVDVDMRERGPLWWRLVMLATRNDWSRTDSWSHAAAEAVLRGAPGAPPAVTRALARRTLGAVPTTPEGQAYLLGEDGIRDPLRGLYRPSAPRTWQDLVAGEGAPLVRLLRTISHLRSEVSFDEEPRVAGEKPNADPARSLHVRLRLNPAL